MLLTELAGKTWEVGIVALQQRPLAFAHGAFDH